MPNFRIVSNLIWDVEADDEESAKVKASKMRNVIDLFPDSKWGSISANKLRDEEPKGKKKVKKLMECSPDEVFAFVPSSRQEYTVGDKTYSVKMASQRYMLFKENRCCVVCGLEGSRMCLELPPDTDTPHFNLYGVEREKYILMTKDHKTPVSVGGKNDLENYQTMCSICNGIKGSDPLSLEELLELRKFYNENLGETNIHKKIIVEKECLLGK